MNENTSLIVKYYHHFGSLELTDGMYVLCCNVVDVLRDTK
jgi:hypothetical protein